jgi:Tol biopolymer transport system component
MNGYGSQAFSAPQWSPTGTIAFYASTGPTAHDIWAISASGSEARPLSSDPADEYWPNWSHDGLQIAFDRVVDSARNLNQLVVADANGGNARMLATSPLQPAGPVTWSPDGTRLLGYPWNEEGLAPLSILILDATQAEQGDAPSTIHAPSALASASWQRLAP